MRALFVHDHQFSLDADGVFSDKLPYEIWKRYLAHFDDLTVFARAIEHETVKLPRSDGPSVSFQFSESISSFRSFWGARRRVASALSKAIDGVDVVIVRLPSELGLMACSLARKQGKPYAAEVVGCAWDALWNYGSLKGKVYAPVLYSRMRRAVAQCQHVLYVSQVFLQTRYPAKAALRTVSVSNVELAPLDLTNVSKRLVAAPVSPLKVGLIGSLKTRYKGVDLAIQALAELKKRGTTVSLSVLGGGNPEPFRKLAVEAGVSENVHFEGLLAERDAVMQWLDTVDVYIQPSRQEGVPRSLIEAMSRGCPAIASHCAGIPELLPEDCLVPVGDHQQLAEKLIFAVRNKEWRDAKCRENFDRAIFFEKEKLDKKRSHFWSDVAASAREVGGLS